MVICVIMAFILFWSKRKQGQKCNPGILLYRSSNLMKASRLGSTVTLYRGATPSPACSLDLSILWSAHTEMVLGPLETLQMGQLVPYCWLSHADIKMPHKCQGKPSWLHSTYYSSVIHPWTAPKKRPLSYTWGPLLTVCDGDSRHKLVQYFICLFFFPVRTKQSCVLKGQQCAHTRGEKLSRRSAFLLFTKTEACFFSVCGFNGSGK